MGRMAIAAWLMTATVALAAPPRNVVLIIGDDHGLQVGCYGDPVARTPSLDRLAAGGTRFANAFAAVSSCSPSRSVILTGAFNHTTGQYGLQHSDHHFQSFDDVRSVTAVLKSAGYRTAIVGKYHVGPPQVYPFDEHLATPGGHRNVAAMAKSARQFMAASGDRPFFLLVGFADPHRGKDGFDNDRSYPDVEIVRYDPKSVPVPPWLPDNADVRGELAEYYQSVSRMDQGVGKIVEAIQAAGRADDTLVIYVSDNGPPFPGAKTTLYEPGIHMPLIVAVPGGRPGVVSRAMVSLVDIAPTILDWAGVPVPKTVFGRSLLPILNNENPPGWDVVYGSHTFHEVTMYYPMRMIRTRQHKYIRNLAHPLEYPFASDLWESKTWQGVLRRGDPQYGRRTVAALLHRPLEELYDLQKDPGETVNVAADPQYAGVLEDLRERLKAWQQATKDPWRVKYLHE